MNVTGVIITTNHKVGGLFLPPDDRRHFVAWSTVERSAFDEAYWAKYWGWLERWRRGGGRAIICGGSTSRGFNPKAPPPRTQAFWEMVNAMRSEKESEMEDIIDSLDKPTALTISDLISRASTVGRHGFVDFLEERKNARVVGIRLEQCGYRRFANPNEKTGRWRVGGQRTGVYVAKELTDREAFRRN